MQALQRQQQLQQRLSGGGQQHKVAGCDDGKFEPLHLHRALANVQHDVLQDTSSADTARTDEQMPR